MIQMLAKERKHFHLKIENIQLKVNDISEFPMRYGELFIFMHFSANKFTFKWELCTNHKQA